MKVSHSVRDSINVSNVSSRRLLVTSASLVSDSQFFTGTHTLNQCASMGLMTFLFGLNDNAIQTHYDELGPIDFSRAHPRDSWVLGRKMNTVHI